MVLSVFSAIDVLGLVRQALLIEAAKKALKGIQGHGAYTEKCNENLMKTDESNLVRLTILQQYILPILEQNHSVSPALWTSKMSTEFPAFP